MIEISRRERFRQHLARWGIPILAILIPLQFAANVAVAAIGYADVRGENDRQDADRIGDAIASCNRGNESRASANAIVDAVALGREIKLRQSEAERDQARFLIDALVGDATLSPDDQARADGYLADIDASQAVIDVMLEEMAGLITAARRPIRDCRPEVVLEVPEVTVPSG